MPLAGYGNLDEQFSEYLRWIKWVVRLPVIASGFKVASTVRRWCPTCIVKRHVTMRDAAVDLGWTVAVQRQRMQSSNHVVRLVPALIMSWAGLPGRQVGAAHQQPVAVADRPAAPGRPGARAGHPLCPGEGSRPVFTANWHSQGGLDISWTRCWASLDAIYEQQVLPIHGSDANAKHRTSALPLCSDASGNVRTRCMLIGSCARGKRSTSSMPLR